MSPLTTQKRARICEKKDFQEDLASSCVYVLRLKGRILHFHILNAQR